MLFVLNLYCNTRPNDVDTLGSLWWYMFSKYQYERDLLPPIKNALLHMMYRSHYIARVWRSAHISKSILPDPCKFSWKLGKDIKNFYEPIMTDQKPAPVSVVELSFCRCKHGCDTKCCTCKKITILSAVKCVLPGYWESANIFQGTFIKRKWKWRQRKWQRRHWRLGLLKKLH